MKTFKIVGLSKEDAQALELLLKDKKGIWHFAYNKKSGTLVVKTNDVDAMSLAQIIISKKSTDEDKNKAKDILKGRFK